VWVLKKVAPAPEVLIIGIKRKRKGKKMKLLIVFYSTYGHIYRMAEAVAEGAREIPGADVRLRQAPEKKPLPGNS
jgi:hypothetical protein